VAGCGSFRLLTFLPPLSRVFLRERGGQGVSAPDAVRGPVYFPLQKLNRLFYLLLELTVFLLITGLSAPNRGRAEPLPASAF